MIGLGALRSGLIDSDVPIKHTAKKEESVAGRPCQSPGLRLIRTTCQAPNDHVDARFAGLMPWEHSGASALEAFFSSDD